MDITRFSLLLKAMNYDLCITILVEEYYLAPSRTRGDYSVPELRVIIGCPNWRK